MRMLKIDRLRELYREKQHPAVKPYVLYGKEITFLADEAGTSLSVAAALSSDKIKGALIHAAAALEVLRDLEREDTFIKGFRCAEELYQKEK